MSLTEYVIRGTGTGPVSGVTHSYGVCEMVGVSTMTDVYVGRTFAGTKVYVSAKLTAQAGEWQTVTHGTVTAPVTLAIQGVIVRKGGSYSREGDWEGVGQFVAGELRKIQTPADGWTVADARKLADVWDRWHLNTMRAGCAHQPAESLVYEEGRHGRQIDLVRTPSCPETGYRYGQAWLTEELPADVETFIRERFGLSA